MPSLPKLQTVRALLAWCWHRVSLLEETIYMSPLECLVACWDACKCVEQTK